MNLHDEQVGAVESLQDWAEPSLEILPIDETAFGLLGPGDGGGPYS